MVIEVQGNVPQFRLDKPFKAGHRRNAYNLIGQLAVRLAHHRDGLLVNEYVC